MLVAAVSRHGPSSRGTASTLAATVGRATVAKQRPRAAPTGVRSRQRGIVITAPCEAQADTHTAPSQHEPPSQGWQQAPAAAGCSRPCSRHGTVGQREEFATTLTRTMAVHATPAPATHSSGSPPFSGQWVQYLGV